MEIKTNSINHYIKTIKYQQTQSNITIHILDKHNDYHNIATKE